MLAEHLNERVAIPMPCREALAISTRAQRWLLCSGVIKKDGAAIAWLAPENPMLQFTSAEITGYAASFFCWTGSHTEAMRCAQWLVTSAQDTFGAFRCRWYSADVSPGDFAHDGPIRWSFDTGIAIKGLVDTHRLIRSDELVPPIEAAAQFLLDIRRPDGLFPGRWNIDRWQAADDLTRWSAQPGAYHAKIDLGLALAALTFNRPAWLDGLEYRVDTYVDRFQADDGRFVSYPATGGLHAHPHLYTCESLWALGKILDVQRWCTAAHRGIQWLANRAIIGYPPRTLFHGKANFCGRCDVAAQYLRSLLLFEHPPQIIGDAYAHLCTYVDEAGAFVFGWDADGTHNTHSDTWGTMAAIQALDWFAGNEPPDPARLI